MSMSRIILVATVTLLFVDALFGSVRVTPVPPTAGTNDFYVSNARPLAPNPLIKLPVGAVKPQGWLRRQLELQAEGFSGRLTEISQFLRKDGNAWLAADGEGHSPWEEMPYWLKGFGDTGYVLGDQRIIDEAKVWIEGILNSRKPDGWFGPLPNRRGARGKDGKPDLWPNMIALNALQSYYEFTGDPRVLELMQEYFKWELTVPEEDFLPPFWQQQRASDNLASVYWLYNRTGQEYLLQLAEKIHRNTADWTETVASWHNVNIAQCFRAPAIYYQQARDPYFLQATERNYNMIWGVYGQVPGGMFGGDENCRRGYYGPRQGIETCASVEFMLSCEMLLAITGDLTWADRCEDVTFNTFPPSMTADLKGLHYLVSPNQCQLDSQNKSPGIQNRGEMFSYNPHRYRCCQHNVAHGWPYLAEHLWMATPDNGLAAVFYAASEVTAQVGAGQRVTLKATTHYPFEDTIQFAVTTARPVQFPLYLRVPGWCAAPALRINGKKTPVYAEPRTFIVIDRQWKDGDTVELTLPMELRLRYWIRNGNSVSVERGPLTYSLKIGEKYTRYAGTDEWPAFEVYPTTAWNYGLVIDADKPLGAQFEVRPKSWPKDNQPFEAQGAPIEIRAKAKKIPTWQPDALGLIGEVQPSPIRSQEPVETVTLIPMGAARLRISAFPWIGESPNAREWQQLPARQARLAARASHCWHADTTDALSDGELPANSRDGSIRRFTWWPRRGTREWVEYDFPKPRQVSQAEVYWYDDAPTGGCRPPQAWKLLYKDGDNWKDIPNPSAAGLKPDQLNKMTFDPVQTAGLRLEVQLQERYSAGILEWRVP
ncbi:MAG: transcriptional initiation protein Tat [Planctomycetes bacterium]|nr:transcriptional initiation protein Tat [Planctomycetota bacterium]